VDDSVHVRTRVLCGRFGPKLLQFGELTQAPRTARGRATRGRIVGAAAALIRERGVAETSLDDVIEAARVSKSQLYLYFDSRAALLREVVAHNANLVLTAQEPHLGSLESWKAIRVWLDTLVELQVGGGARGGCPVGSLVGQLAEGDEQARQLLADSFERWEDPLRQGLRTMQKRGKLDRRADPDRLATATLASIQGGLVLTQSRRDPGQLALALDAAYAYLRSHAAPVEPRRKAPTA
jgi:TetR/AcrR family transcriptional regulator, transcriptional repressor for nem operon